MQNRLLKIPVKVCCLSLLPFCAANAFACSDSATITSVPSLGGSTYLLSAMNAAGQVTGFSYIRGNVGADAILYGDGGLLDLGTLGGGVSQGFAINGAGQVVGESYTAGGQTHAFLYSAGRMWDLGTLGGTYSSAIGINDAGQVAGTATIAGDAALAAFRYDNGQKTALGSLGGGGSSPVAINQAGTVVGDSWTADFDYHAFLYANGPMLDLGTLGGNYSSASAVNGAGVVVGESTLANEDTHAFAFAGGQMVDLGALSGTFSSAWAVNNSGQIIGVWRTAPQGPDQGFLYSGGVMTDLGNLGGAFTVPCALNNLGQVVGASATVAGPSHAFSWKNGTMEDLNSLVDGSGWELQYALFINDSGRIVGVGTYQGVQQYFVLDTGSVNHAPVAVAGPDQVAECPSQVTLDGSQSSDPDNDPLTYEWSLGGSVVGTNPVLTASFPMGTNVVTLKVADPCQASSQASVTVVVLDTTAPVITAQPSQVTVPADGNGQGVVPDVMSQVVVADNCAAVGELTKTQSPAAGTLLARGDYTIVVTVTDASTNSTAASIPFSVVDQAPPAIAAVTANPNVISPPNHALVPVTVSVVAQDNCDPAPVSRIVSVTANEPTTPDEIQITGDLTVLLAASRDSSGTGRVYTITVVCADLSGNSSTGTVTVTVPKGKK